MQCKACGEPGLPARSSFCLNCGAPVSRDTAPTAYTPAHLARDVLVFRDAEGGERKEVTVLIADVAGSLAMAAALDPEDVHALMDGFFALALEAVHGHGGVVNQFRGDGFMALFGAPRARGDDVARALRAALEVRERSREYADSVRARHGLPFAVRIGVSTGLVWVGAIGNQLRRDYTAEGPTVGLAARLEGLASPGQILVSEETQRRAPGFDTRDLGVRSVRGLDEPQRVHELIVERPPTLRIGAGVGPAQTPFVGRASELARVRRALRGDGCQVVELRGEGGVGKSRLALEALRDLPASTLVLELACRESNARRAYAPWLPLLRAWPARGPDAQHAAELAQSLEGRTRPRDPEEAERMLRALLRRLLEGARLVIVVEDANWLDPSSRRLVDALIHDPPEGSLCWIATQRDDQPGGWTSATPTLRVTLAPLGSADALELAERAAEGLEPGLAQLACLRGGGNPLFIEEVARALRDGSPELRAAAQLELRLSRARERVPETLRGVVTARIDALPEDAKRVLEMAAVVDERFDAGLVGDVLPGLSESPDAMLALLVARGLLQTTPQGEYDFCHGVVQDGACAQLVRERLGALHRRTAEALAKRPLGETAEGASRIGHHYDCAGDASAAVPELLRAGRIYTSMRGLLEAVAHLRRAFELARTLEGGSFDLEGSVGLSLAGALAALDRGGEAAAVLEGLDVERVAAADRASLAALHVQTGWLRFSNDNDVARGRGLVERGLRVADALAPGGDIGLLARSYLARMDLLDGRLGEALAWTAELAERATAKADRMSLALARYNESWVHCEAGRTAEARRATDDALTLAAAQPGDLLAGITQSALARVLYFEGNADGALQVAARAEKLSGRSGQVGFQSHALVVAGYAHLLLGEATSAQRCFERLVPLGARWPSTLLHRARGALEVGDFATAEELARRALDAPRAIRARALAVRGLALGLSGGRKEEAETALAEAINLCDALGLRPSLAEAQTFQAELCRRLGDRARASYYAARAGELYTSCGMPEHAKQAQLLLR